MATITKRGNSYKITVTVGTDAKGRKLREYMTYTPTAKRQREIEREVRRAADEFEDRVKNGRYLSGDKLSFIQFADIWEKEWAEDHVTLSVLEGYKDILKRRVYPYIGSMKLSKINALHVQNIYQKMKEEGKAPKTIKRTNSAINSVFRYAYRMGIIAENPCSRVELPKNRADTGLHFFTLEQSQRFLDSLAEGYVYHHPKKVRSNGRVIPAYDESIEIPLQYRAFFTLAIFSGCRRGELIALNWHDVDFEECTISISKAVADTSQGQIIKGTKTASGNRKMVLPEECFTVLRQWKKQEKELAVLLGSKWEGFRGRQFDDNYIFIQLDSGLMMNLSSPRQKFLDIIKYYNNMVDADKTLSPEEKEAKKLPSIRLHDLRHTSATLLLAYGVDIETVSKRMGHSKASITLDIYGHALEEMDKKASDTLGNLFARRA